MVAFVRWVLSDFFYTTCNVYSTCTVVLDVVRQQLQCYHLKTLVGALRVSGCYAHGRRDHQQMVNYIGCVYDGYKYP